MTLAQTVAETTLSLEVNGSTYTCLGTGADCSYSTSSSMPVVTSIALQDSHTLVFTGVGFEYGSFPAQVSFLDVLADSVSVESDVQVTATFTNGVPLSQSPQKPLLFF